MDSAEIRKVCQYVFCFFVIIQPQIYTDKHREKTSHAKAQYNHEGFKQDSRRDSLNF